MFDNDFDKNFRRNLGNDHMLNMAQVLFSNKNSFERITFDQRQTHWNMTIHLRTINFLEKIVLISSFTSNCLLLFSLSSSSFALLRLTYTLFNWPMFNRYHFVLFFPNSKEVDMNFDLFCHLNVIVAIEEKLFFLLLLSFFALQAASDAC